MVPIACGMLGPTRQPGCDLHPFVPKLEDRVQDRLVFFARPAVSPLVAAADGIAVGLEAEPTLTLHLPFGACFGRHQESFLFGVGRRRRALMALLGLAASRAPVGSENVVVSTCMPRGVLGCPHREHLYVTTRPYSVVGSVVLL